MLGTSLVGTWKLVTWTHTLPDGSIFEPMGKGSEGLLVYTPELFMSAQLMGPRRKKFRSPGLFSGTDEEKALASGSYVAYAGTYRVEHARVFHMVTLSLFPNWVGTEQERHFEIDGDRLTLSTPPFTSKGKGPQVAHLVWERITAA